MIAGRTVAIVGLGLIGGSLARAFAARGARVLGYDRDPAALGQAIASGCVHETLDRSLDAAAAADWAIIALPIGAIAEALERLAPHRDRLSLIMDVGSTKRGPLACARALGLRQFVGSHPMAGCHTSGWSASRDGLFDGATVYLCADSGGAAEPLALAAALWRTLGGTPVECSAEEHDAHVAWVSHLPHLASFALALAMRGEGKLPRDLGPGGRDALRLAGSSPEMWRDIALANAPAIAAAISALEDELRAFRGALEAGDAASLEQRLTTAASWRRSA